MKKNSKRINFFIIFFIVLLSIIKIFYLYYLKLPLSYDEAYYWDWSRNLDFGYYSKPPMIAYLIYLSTKIFGNSEFSVRIPALICTLLTLLFSYLLWVKYVERVDRKKAFYFILNLSFIPIITVYSFIMTPDSPLLLFWVAAIYFFSKYLEEKSYKSAFLTGLFIGLGLLTKQTMFLFLFIMSLYLLLINRKIFFKKGTLFLYLISFFIYLPNLYWNYKNKWMLLTHTKEHFYTKTFSFIFLLKFFTEAILVYTPFFLIFIYLGFKFMKNWKNSPEILKFLYILSFPVVILLLILSFFIRLNINWIMPIVITGIILSFFYIEVSKKWEILMLFNLGIAFIFSFLIGIFGYFPHYFPQNIQLLLKHFKGWKFLAQEVEKYSNLNLPILAEHRAIASELAFYIKEHPKVYVISLKAFPENQYHLWRKDSELIGKKVILVKKGDNVPFYLVDSRFLEKIVIKINKERRAVYTIWVGRFKKL